MALLAPAAGAAPGSTGAEAGGFGAYVDGATHAAASASTAGRPSNGAAESALVVTGASIGRVALSASTTENDGGGATARTVAAARDVNLLGGRIVAASVEVGVHATSGPAGVEAGLDRFAAPGLRVDGQPVPVVPGSQVPVPGVGTLTMFEQVRDADGTLRANGLRLLVTDPASGLPQGSELVVGYVTAHADPVPAATPIPALAAPPDQPPPPGDRPPVETSPEAPPPQSLPQAPEEPATPPPTPAPGPPLPGLPPLVPPSAPGLRVFPVAGPASFVDDYGAPRAGTGWHHGNDIFADRNTPVVAVADGTLSLVGVNPLGGNRLWLTDDTGTSYYYAHLQGYAPVAVDGARVRAGEILGYVGNTGQAVTTPTHLHFEVHPDGGDSVDPYPYLVAWENNTDLSGQSPFEVQSQSAGAVLIGAVQQVDAPAPGDGLAHAVS